MVAAAIAPPARQTKSPAWALTTRTQGALSAMELLFASGSRPRGSRPRIDLDQRHGVIESHYSRFGQDSVYNIGDGYPSGRR
ncbi:hypothetical protein GCM10009776_23130 [Microbacterium deminutum]|uniref:Uncharacterized protein n=1 Tax=Microbacterium deminutum TaxID=344164 RepID=A0ABN2QXI7_9MICO